MSNPITLTDRKLGATNPDPKRTAIYDDKVTGFHFRPSTTRKGVGAFYLLYSVDGKRRRQKIGNYPATALADARQNALKLLAGIGEGKVPDTATEHRQKARRIAADSFAAVADRYINQYCKTAQREKTWRETERLLTKVAVPKFRNRPLKDIKRRDIADLLADVVAGKIEAAKGQATAITLRAYLSGMWNWAEENGIETEGNPIPRRKYTVGSLKPRDRVLSADECRKVWQATQTLSYPYGPFYRFLMLTGQRTRQDCAAIRWRDVHDLDSDQAMWIMEPEGYKTGIKHHCPLSRPAVEELLSMRDFQQLQNLDYEYVFVSGFKGDSPINGWGKLKKRLDDASGVTGWRNHDLRRTMRTWMEAQPSIGKDVASRCLGHLPQGMDRVYGSAEPVDRMRAALDEWAAHLVRFDEKLGNVVPIR